MTEPTRIPIALYRTMAGVVSQLEGDTVVPQATAADLWVLTEPVFVFSRINTSKQEVS
jgi:hypothetical protein